MTDAELVERAQRGSRDAATLLFERHWDRAWRIARTLAGGAAEDLFTFQTRKDQSVHLLAYDSDGRLVRDELVGRGDGLHGIGIGP